MAKKGLGSLEGRVRRCIRYKTGKGGRKVCAKYAAGPGRPRGRKKAGIKRKFVERSTTKKRAKRVCAKYGKKAGKRRCIRWRHISAAAAKKLRRGKKRTCLRWGKSKTGKRVCRKYAGSGSMKRRKRSPLKGTKRRCLSWGKNRLGRRVCRKYAKSRSGGESLGGLFGMSRKRKGRSCRFGVNKRTGRCLKAPRRKR